jgi:hypothetical protein
MSGSLVQMPAPVVGLSCLRTLALLNRQRQRLKEKFYEKWNQLRQLLGRKTLTKEQAAAYFDGEGLNPLEYAGYFMVSTVGASQTKRLRALMDLAKAAPPGSQMLVCERDFQTFKPGFDELITEAKLEEQKTQATACGKRN